MVPAVMLCESTPLPTRLIICVDGTWCTPDGPHGNNADNISNIYRIFASVKEGPVNSCGKTYHQQVKYYPGIGSNYDIAWIERLHTGAFGSESLNQVRDVYERCCKLGPQDEVWLYGFSRGAYVVRAVAGLLHYMKALVSAHTSSFEENYSHALEVYRALHRNSRLGPGSIHEHFKSKTRDPPKVHFLGVFDTVKAVNDQSLFDISFNTSIEHLRHAVALNEDRSVMTPEYLFPEFNGDTLRDRSFIQAWFLGAHIDMGGSTAKDGLALYPLQWMLLESEKKGLVLEFDTSFNKQASIDNPLKVVFLEDEADGKGRGLWACKVRNGLTVEMQDVRKVHGLPKYKGRYGLRLNRNNAVFWPRKMREPFAIDGYLNGYCEYAPQGTIVHPSVYMILEHYPCTILKSTDLSHRLKIDQWGTRNLELGGGDFWDDDQPLRLEENDPIRILLCGDTGVGKSTLINSVFGSRVAESSHRTAGIHDVNQPLTIKDRPDLVIHDSGGFEAGTSIQLDHIRKFVIDKSNIVELKDRLHTIWFCIELNDPRVQKSSTRNLFKLVSQHAKDVPIIVVGTKKDEFKSVKSGEARNWMPSAGMSLEDYFAALDQEAEKEVTKRMKLIEKELKEIEGGRYDAAVPVSRLDEDKESIELLTGETLRCFSHERIRMLFIAAEAARIDLKVEVAIAETMRVYKHSIGSAASLGMIPAAPTITRVSVVAVVCQKIVSCFGIHTVNYQTILAIVKSVIWDDIRHNFQVLLAEMIAVGGLGVLNIVLNVPSTARHFLMLAADIILILVQAFKYTTDKRIGQPGKEDIEKAAYEYRALSHRVHKRVKKLVPKSNVVKSFQVKKINIGLEKIIEDYRHKIIENTEATLRDERPGNSDSDDTTLAENEMEDLKLDE